MNEHMDRDELRQYLVGHARADRAPSLALQSAITRVTKAASGAAVGFGAVSAAASAGKAAPALAAKWLIVGAIAGAATVGIGEGARYRHATAPEAVATVDLPAKPNVVAAPARRVEAAEPSAVAVAPVPPPAARARVAPSDDEEVIDEPVVPTAAAPSAASPSGIGRELALLDDARSAIVRGDAASALAALARYDREFAAGGMSSEAAALRVEALMLAGRQDEARALGDAFLSRYPRSPLVSRVRKAIGK